MDLNGGSNGGNGALLQGVEFDGYLTVSEGSDTITLPWHILPHKAANVTPATTSLSLGGGSSATLPVANSGGAAASLVDVFSLTGTSPKLPSPCCPNPATTSRSSTSSRSVSARWTPGGQTAVQFAITTWGDRSHPNYPAEFDVYIDANLDGTDDFAVFNRENGGFVVSGQNVTTVVNLATNAQITKFYTNADLSSENATLTVLASDIGLTSNSQFKFLVAAADNYFTGTVTDVVDYMTYTLGTPRYSSTSVTLAPGASTNLAVTAAPGGALASPSQTGLLLLYTNGKKGRESDVITIQP